MQAQVRALLLLVAVSAYLLALTAAVPAPVQEQELPEARSRRAACPLTYALTSTWSSGFVGQVTLTDAQYYQPRLYFEVTFPTPVRMYGWWNADMVTPATANGAAVTASYFKFYKGAWQQGLGFSVDQTNGVVVTPTITIVGVCDPTTTTTTTTSTTTTTTTPAPFLFGRMFPNLPPIADPGDNGADLQRLANVMKDDNFDSDTNDVTSGFTYFGQFVDHDLTKDPVPFNVSANPNAILNGRTFRFDLDSVYGGGPSVNPELYNGATGKFLVQEPNVNGVRDLPRDPATGRAIISENRNDENEIISQIQVAFYKFHNALIDRGLNFTSARRVVIKYYQWVVVHEHLPHIVGQDEVDAALARLRLGTSFYNPGNVNAPMTPVEFAVGAYRFGHSQVRKAYVLNFNSIAKQQVFAEIPVGQPLSDLRGGRPLPADRQIDWGMFIKELYPVYPAPICNFETQRARPDCAKLNTITNVPVPTNCVAPYCCCLTPGTINATGTLVDPVNSAQGRNAPNLPPINLGRKIDALLSSGLFTLPIGNKSGDVQDAGDNKLGFRNMLRSQLYGMASGQDVAAAMGVPVLTPQQIANIITAIPNASPRITLMANNYFATNPTPLWFYILVEAGQGGGNKLGPVGARIVADVILGVLAADSDSILNRSGFSPRRPIGPVDGTFRLADLMVFAGVASYPDANGFNGYIPPLTSPANIPFDANYILGNL